MGQQESSGSVASEVKAGAREALDAGKERTRSFFEEQKVVLARKVNGFANALHESARSLEQQSDGRSTAILAHRMADGMERLAHSMEERDLRGVFDECEDFARRSPAAFVGGAVTAGFFLARFFKSSRERRERSAYGGEPYGEERYGTSAETYGSAGAYGGYGASAESYRPEQRAGEPYSQQSSSYPQSGEHYGTGRYGTSEQRGQTGPSSPRYGTGGDRYAPSGGGNPAQRGPGAPGSRESDYGEPNDASGGPSDFDPDRGPAAGGGV